MAVGVPQWGQKLTVDLITPAGSLVRLVDYDQGAVTGLRKESLTCKVLVKRHLRPEPYTSEVTIWNLSLPLQTLLYNTVRFAKEMSYLQQMTLRAGRIMITAGRDPTRFMLIADDQIVDLEPGTDGADSITTIKGVDGRLAWDALFSTESSFTPPISASVAAQMGVVPPPVPDALPSSVVTYHLHGAGKADAMAVFARLGMIPVWRGDLVLWLPTDGTLTLPPVILDSIAKDPIAPPGVRGTRTVQCMHDPWLLCGRQAVFRAEPCRIESLDIALDTGPSNVWDATVGTRPIGPV